MQCNILSGPHTYLHIYNHIYGHRPFGIFLKVHPFLYRHQSLTKQTILTTRTTLKIDLFDNPNQPDHVNHLAHLDYWITLTNWTSGPPGTLGTLGPPGPSPIQFSPVLPYSAQCSTAKCSPVQPSTVQWRPVQPIILVNVVTTITQSSLSETA